MNRFKVHLVLAGIAAVAGAAALLLFLTDGYAADHRESPATNADAAADLADVYCWHESGKLYAVLTVAGLITQHLDTAPVFDTKIAYTVNIDNTGDSVPDVIVDVRFGKNIFGQMGVRVVGLPGATGTVSGPVEQVIASGPTRVFAGVRDDPFFFDLAGFRTTLATGTLSFDNTRNGFAGFQVVAIALEMDLLAAQGGDAGAILRVWGETGRLSN
ncbi:MAG: DUF4331 domain-containing protein [Planctomycetes bacterium]|nr:DUF4331 domain-containing protein [Planctomycetota bacterium]